MYMGFVTTSCDVKYYWLTTIESTAAVKSLQLQSAASACPVFFHTALRLSEL
jgi:hypothetical protein